MARKADKVMESSELAVKNIPQLKALFDAVKKDVVKTQIKNVHSLEEYADQFPVEHCISSGIPVLDMNLFSNKDGTEWGFPCSRWSEIAGIEGIGKTYVCHQAASYVLRKDGMVFWVQSEGEFDAEHSLAIHKANGVDVDNPDKLNQIILSARSLEDLYNACKSILSIVREIKKEFETKNPGESFRKNSPPILVVVDSFAAMVSSIDRDAIEEKGWEKNSRMGSKAKEFHVFFQMVLNEFAELGIAGIGTNHLRASMDAYGPDTVAAHDSALKYYMSFRMTMDKHPKSGSKYYDLTTKSYTKNGRVMIPGYPVRFKITKKRGVRIEDGIIEVPFFNGFGFDYLYALIDAAITVGAIKTSAKGMSLFQPTRKEMTEDPIYEQIWAKLPKGKDSAYSNGALVRELLASDEELVVDLITLCYKYGPEPSPDKRGKAAKGTNDEDED